MAIEQLRCSKLASLQGVHYYGGAYSNSCMRVTLLMEEKGLNWRSHGVNLMRSENLQEPYTSISPGGTIPAIIHNGVAVSDSFHILKYLEEQFPEQRFLPENESDIELMWNSVRLACDSHIDYNKSYFYAVVGGRPCSQPDLEWYRKHNPALYEFHTKYPDGMTSKQKLEVIERISKLCAQMDAELKGKDYLIGNRYSLADIAWIANFLFLEVLNFDLSSYPYLVAWMARIKARPAYNSKTRIPNVPLWLMKVMLLIKRTFLRIKGAAES
ncbi:glutathione S-transferase family protein [Ferrimonas aestuarii]|uniref:Glutathione S-transferase family protein n=1 Tax=Ferrimonas aestuarii TaxID=2569539 RepID=A0A4U1BP80_9GAMM|nr:glutathione S-transferase family protein [Ferrimonas aestuarii]TKB55516.1 glutathione S-transferase family protein [Ferrimonas aestuarii]